METNKDVVERKTFNTTGMDIHRIVSVTIEQHQQEKTGAYVTEIAIMDCDGHRTEIDMFSKDKIKVEYKKEGED